MITRSQACLLAAQAELDSAKQLRGKERELELHAAEMRANRILNGCSGRRLPDFFEAKVQAQMRATEAIGA